MPRGQNTEGFSIAIILTSNIKKNKPSFPSHTHRHLPPYLHYPPYHPGNSRELCSPFHYSGVEFEGGGGAVRPGEGRSIANGLTMDHLRVIRDHAGGVPAEKTPKERERGREDRGHVDICTDVQMG